MNGPNPPKRNWDGIGWIVFASAAGGFLSWLCSMVLKQPLCDSVLLSFTCSILSGILAGGTGVYVFKLVDHRASIGRTNPQFSFLRGAAAFAVPAMFVLGFSGCVTAPLATERHVKGAPQPNRWKEFLAQAERGRIEEVADEPEESSISVHWIDYQLGVVRRTAAGSSEVFKGNFRPEAKTSYSKARKERGTDIESLLNKLPTDAQMTQQHHELISKDRKHENHVPRIADEQRNVTVKAWLYWVGHQRDNDYHLILGDTSELSSGTVFMNAEISGLPKANPTQRPFVKLRGTLRQVLTTNHNVKGAFVNPVPVRITGSLLWDGEHRNPHNVGPKKPVDIRPKKAWEIHPIHDLVH